MSDDKIVEINSKGKTDNKSDKNAFNNRLQTNPILQRMIKCNESSKKIKFKLKDLFK